MVAQRYAGFLSPGPADWRIETSRRPLRQKGQIDERRREEDHQEGRSPQGDQEGPEGSAGPEGRPEESEQHRDGEVDDVEAAVMEGSPSWAIV